MEEETGRTPPSLAARPERLPHLELVWIAFWELSTTRSFGFGVGPIPWTAIAAYAEWTGIPPGEEMVRFTALIRAMDHTYMEQTKPKDAPKNGR